MIYVDTSAIVALLTVEPKTQAVMAWYAGLREVPYCADWLLTEFSSALSIKMRARQVTEDQARMVRKEFKVLTAGGLRLVPVSRAAFKRAADLVKPHRFGLRAGNSLHLAVALELGVSHMATLDRTLANNAEQKGLKRIVF